jgi:hypothetical protein
VSIFLVSIRPLLVYYCGRARSNKNSLVGTNHLAKMATEVGENVLNILEEESAKSVDDLFLLNSLDLEANPLVAPDSISFYEDDVVNVSFGEKRTVQRVFVRHTDLNTDGVGWVLNKCMPECMVCQKEFNSFRWKHHCRACGNIVCDDCSAHDVRIVDFPEFGEQRVCSLCYWGQEEVYATKVRLREDVVAAVAEAQARARAQSSSTREVRSSSLQLEDLNRMAFLKTLAVEDTLPEEVSTAFVSIPKPEAKAEADSEAAAEPASESAGAAAEPASESAGAEVALVAMERAVEEDEEAERLRLEEEALLAAEAAADEESGEEAETEADEA